MEETVEKPEQRSEVRSLSKGLTILRLFTSERPQWTIEDVARKTGFPRPTAYRLVKTLEANEFLALNSSDNHYELGPALFASQYLLARPLKLEKLLHQDLEALAAATGESSNLVVAFGHSAGVHVDYVAGTAPIRLVMELGVVAPSLASSPGKILAAYRDDKEIDGLLAESLRRYTANTITDKDAMRAELMRVRETGIAFDLQEYSESLCGVSAPVRDESGEVAAVVSLVVVPERFSSERREALAKQVQQTGENMSARLGYRKLS